MESASATSPLWDRLRDTILAAGCDAVGITTADPFPDVRHDLEERRATGMSAGMHFTFGDPARSTDIKASFPWARSIVVAGAAYLPESGSPGPAGRNQGRIARFATQDHYRPLRAALTAGCEILNSADHRAEVVVDDNRLVDRAAAVRAGVGWWGKNTMVLAPGVGPWMLLGSIVTDAPLEATPPMIRDCGTCRACLPACPTGALIAPGLLDARLCLAHVLQAPDWIPRGLRSLVGDRIYGCDDCLDACPPGVRLEAAALPQPRIDMLGLLALSDDDLLARFAHFYVPRRRASYLRRNMLVALGNCGDERALESLTSHLSSLDPMLRAHAAWALGNLGGPAATAALERAAAAETDPDVAEEIAAARETAAGQVR